MKMQCPRSGIPHEISVNCFLHIVRDRLRFTRDRALRNELTFTIPPALLDDSLSNVLPVLMAPAEMSGQLKPLSGAVYKMRLDGFLQAFLIEPAEICQNLAALNETAWLAVYMDGAKRKPNVFGPAIADQSLWISKGESGQQAFDDAFAAWEKTRARAERTTACQPS